MQSSSEKNNPQGNTSKGESVILKMAQKFAMDTEVPAEQ